MPVTTIESSQIRTQAVQRSDLNISTAGQAVIAKVIAGAGITLGSTGMDSGTGDVTVTASLSPGTWTNLSLGTGWTAPTQGQYRLEVNGAISTVRFRGMIQGAWAAIGTTAFTLPSTAFPSMTRSAVVGGAQNTGTASDVSSYLVTVSTAGVATIYWLVGSSFVWPDHSQTQQVYLDGLSYSL